MNRWLSIVGIGEDGLDGLAPTARTLIARAALVVGGRRHLALVSGAVKGETMAWPSPPNAETHDQTAFGFWRRTLSRSRPNLAALARGRLWTTASAVETRRSLISRPSGDLRSSTTDRLLRFNA